MFVWLVAVSLYHVCGCSLDPNRCREDCRCTRREAIKCHFYREKLWTSCGGTALLVGIFFPKRKLKEKSEKASEKNFKSYYRKMNIITKYTRVSVSINADAFAVSVSRCRSLMTDTPRLTTFLTFAGVLEVITAIRRLSWEVGGGGGGGSVLFSTLCRAQPASSGLFAPQQAVPTFRNSNLSTTRKFALLLCP